MIKRDSLDFTIQMVSPSMIAAGEFRRVAAVRRNHHRTPVGALIMNNTELAILVTNQDNRTATHQGGKIITRSFHLTLVPDIYPCPTENALHLQFENCGVGIELPVHPAWLNHFGEVVRAIHAHGGLHQD